MVAFSFKPLFVGPILAREKRQTIRLPRKRDARAGDDLQLFTGARMSPARLGAATCVRVRDVRLDFDAGCVVLDDGVEIHARDELVAFAVRDGFGSHDQGPDDPWDRMRRWWNLTHPGQPIFRGVLTHWDDTFVPVELRSVA